MNNQRRATPVRACRPHYAAAQNPAHFARPPVASVLSGYSVHRQQWRPRSGIAASYQQSWAALRPPDRVYCVSVERSKWSIMAQLTAHLKINFKQLTSQRSSWPINGLLGNGELRLFVSKTQRYKNAHISHALWELISVGVYVWLPQPSSLVPSLVHRSSLSMGEPKNQREFLKIRSKFSHCHQPCASFPTLSPTNRILYTAIKIHTQVTAERPYTYSGINERWQLK